MSFDAGSAKGTLILDDSQYNEALKRSEKGNEGLTKSVFTANLAYDVFKKTLSYTTDIMKGTIDKASQLQEANGKFSVVFKGVSKDAETMRQTLTKSFGLSEIAATKALSSFQDLLVPMGLNRKEAAKLSGDFTKLAVDLGSFNDVANDDVMRDLQSALVGNSETVKKYGIIINEAAMQQESMNLGLGDNLKLLSEAQKARIRYNIIVKSSSDAIGDFARTMESAANQEKINKALLEDLSTTAGNRLLPAYTNLLKTSNSLLQANKDIFNPSIRKSIESEADAVKTLLVELAEQSTSEQRRVEIIKTLNSEYPKLIQNIDLEKVKTGNLADALKLINFETEKRIVNAELQADREELIGFKVGLRNQKLEQERKIRDGMQKAQEAGIDISEIENKSLDEKIKFFEDETFTRRMSLQATGEQVKAIKQIVKASQERNKIIQQTIPIDEGLNDLKKLEVELIDDITSEYVKNNGAIENNTAAKKGNNTATGETVSGLKKERSEWESINSYISEGTKVYDAYQKKQSETAAKTKENMGKALTAIQAFANAAKEIFSMVSETASAFRQQDLDSLIADNENKLAAMEEQQEEERIALDEKYIAEQELLQSKLDNTLITQEEFDAQSIQLDAKKKAEEQALETAQQQSLLDLKRKNLAKENEAEKKAFEADKQNKIASVWIQYAIGLVGLWAQSIASLGPIAGSILAGIMTVALTGVAVANTVLISRQQFIPKKATGGMASGLTMINERGPEIVSLPDGSQVIPNAISRQIADNVGGGGMTVNVSFAGANISDKLSLKTVSDYVINDISRQLRAYV